MTLSIPLPLVIADPVGVCPTVAARLIEAHLARIAARLARQTPRNPSASPVGAEGSALVSPW